jgi:glyoxylase-like metal-dependent hydrolase (beta-lactamase superfamily II)
VKVRADAIPLEEPLAGGVKGASVVVEPLEAGRAAFPDSFFHANGHGLLARARAVGLGSKSSTWTSVPIPAFLVRHPGIGPILVDTGLHPSVATNPNDNLARVTSSHYSLEAGSDVASQLRGKGLRPEDVAVVILTHLHEDHASAMSSFPNAVFVFAAQEWEEATSGRLPALRGYNPSHYDYAFDFNTVDFNGDAIESYGPFGRSFDLFGDGSVRLVFTPGHSAGHTSVFLRLPRRDFVVMGDAAYDWAQFEGRAEPMMMDDEHNWKRSLKELQAYRQQYPYALMVPGHDPEFWPKLEPRYEK